MVAIGELWQRFGRHRQSHLFDSPVYVLAKLGFGGVGSVRQGKVFDVELQETDKAKAEAELKAMCDKLLANTVIENYSVALT